MLGGLGSSARAGPAAARAVRGPDGGDLLGRGDVVPRGDLGDRDADVLGQLLALGSVSETPTHGASVPGRQADATLSPGRQVSADVLSLHINQPSDR
jgi:hypothetical protein